MRAPLPTSPVRMKALADPYLTVKFAEKILKYGPNCPIQGQCRKEYVATGVETFRIYSYMIEPSAHLIRRYGRMRVIQGGKIKFEIYL